MYTPTWQLDNNPSEYEASLQIMESYVQNILSSSYPDKIWLLEHFDVYTSGTSAESSDLINPDSNIPIIKSNRGGKHTYHGIGQRIIYPMLNLNADKDIKKYINNLQQWVILTLNEFNIDAFTKPDLIGVWVLDQSLEKKIAAIGVRVKKWIAYHGIALNINPNLNNFNNIIPCGIRDFSVTSTYDLGKNISYKELDKILQHVFYKVFNEQ